MRRFLLVALLVLLIPSALLADSSSDSHAADVKAVRAAVLDYVEAFYELDPERLERSVHPNVAKLGWTREADGAYREHPRTYEQLLEGTLRFNKSGWIPDDAPKDITIYEVLDKTASVKLTAQWGVDYMHLAKLDGKWMIMNVLWQSHPTE